MKVEAENVKETEASAELVRELMANDARRGSQLYKPFAMLILVSCLSLAAGCFNSMRESDDDVVESGSSSWSVELGVGIRGVCEIVVALSLCILGLERRYCPC